MHSQEPWQSRSPTGSVNKPLISSTLRKTGRKGPHHSYGRGLPVKRKALIILTVAILAFAMIPAIGVGAASADLKIVTPHELAAPSDDDGSAFENLASADYVSDVTGGDNMADTYGTLYAVIEDNDSTANALTTYTAYFTAAGSSDASADFDVAGTVGTVHRGSHKRVQPADDATDADGELTIVTGDALAALRIADRDKDGDVGSGDVTVYLAVGTGGPGEEVTTSRLPQKFVIDAVTSTVTVNLDTRGPGATGGVRIEFTTATQNASTAEIRSAAGDSITIDVEEKNLSYYAELDNNVGVTATEFGDPAVRAGTTTPDADDSVDSGTFVGSFGLIRNGWKDMISDWATDTVTDADSAPNIDPVASPVPDLDTSANPDKTYPDVRAVLVGIDSGRHIVDANGDRKIDHNDVTAQFKALTGETFVSGRTPNERVAIEPTTGVTVTIVKLSARDANGVSCDIPTGSAQAAVTPLDAGANQRVACVEVVVPADTTTRTETTLVTAESTADPPGDPTVGTGFDMVEFTFKTEPSTQALLDAVEEDDAADMHEAFEELGDDRTKLHTALTRQALNLGITVGNGEPASDLVGRLLGVLDKGIVEVRYSDPNPKTTRRATSIVDLALPTVGGFDPAKGSFTTQDSFEVLFSVSDNGAGIPEDAEDDDENTVGNTSTALVAVTVAVGDGGSVDEDAGDHTPAVTQTRESVTDGYQYETDVDVNRNDNNAENINVTVTVTAYDLAGNKAEVDATYIIDTKDPALLGALTGVGAELDNDLARDTKTEPTKGAYKVIENDPNWIALVFDDAINGALLDSAEVVIAGETVDSLLWLDGSGANVITTTGDAKNRETITEDNGAGLELEASGRGQDARNVLFVKLANPLDTSARPAVEIDAADLEDLAGNQDRTDHTIARAHDRLAPALTVTVANPLSNSDLDVNIESSEDLRRIPSASITKVGENPTDVNLTVKRVGSGWTIEAKAKSIGQTTGGVRTISVSAEDEDGNSVTKTAEWELDVGVANPERVGADGSKAHSIETNPVTFLSLKFGAEAGEYDDDSAKTVNITEVSLETLSDGSVKADGTVVGKDKIEVTGTTEVDTASVQSSDQITHVVALTELALGNYRLQVDFADKAGNTGDFGYVFRITAPAPAEVTVVPGWSLVSIPGTPQELSIGYVLEGSAVTDVWSLNNETKVWEFARQDENGEWMGTLTQIVDGRAYFVRSTTFDPISVLTTRFSPQRTPAQYTVTNGWNGIGYTPAGSEKAISVDGYLSALGASGWGMIRTWNASATPPQYETYFSSGAMTTGFPTGDGIAAGAEGADKDDVGNGVAKVEAGKGYLLFATRNGQIGG